MRLNCGAHPPEKWKVGGSTPPLATTEEAAGRATSPTCGFLVRPA